MGSFSSLPVVLRGSDTWPLGKKVEKKSCSMRKKRFVEKVRDNVTGFWRRKESIER